jgi:hypothetical protein
MKFSTFSRWSFLFEMIKYSSMDTLNKLFGSALRVKVMRLFLFNPDDLYETREVVKKVDGSFPSVKKEILLLERTSLIKRRVVLRKTKSRTGKTREGGPGKRRVVVWTLNPLFYYLPQLQSLLIYSTLLHNKEISSRLKKIGKIKLAVVSGVFLQEWDARIDLMIVGDKLEKRSLESVVKKMESEIGRELRYAVFSTRDFKYRLNMNDRLVRDVLDYQHIKIVDKLGL